MSELDPTTIRSVPKDFDRLASLIPGGEPQEVRRLLKWWRGLPPGTLLAARWVPSSGLVWWSFSQAPAISLAEALAMMRPVRASVRVEDLRPIQSIADIGRHPSYVLAAERALYNAGALGPAPYRPGAHVRVAEHEQPDVPLAAYVIEQPREHDRYSVLPGVPYWAWRKWATRGELELWERTYGSPDSIPLFEDLVGWAQKIRVEGKPRPEIPKLKPRLLRVGWANLQADTLMVTVPGGDLWVVAQEPPTPVLTWKSARDIVDNVQAARHPLTGQSASPRAPEHPAPSSSPAAPTAPSSAPGRTTPSPPAAPPMGGEMSPTTTAPTSRPTPLKVDDPVEDVPRLIVGAGRHNRREWALVLRPTDARGMLGYEMEDGLRVWTSDAVGDAPTMPTSACAEKQCVADLKELQRGVGKKPGDITLKGRWKAAMICGTGHPQVVLERAVASYAKLVIRSLKQGLWEWTLTRSARWFAAATTQTGTAGALRTAIAAAAQALEGVVGEACTVRDTRRRGAVDQAYTGTSPAQAAQPVGPGTRGRDIEGFDPKPPKPPKAPRSRKGSKDATGAEPRKKPSGADRLAPLRLPNPPTDGSLDQLRSYAVVLLTQNTAPPDGERALARWVQVEPLTAVSGRPMWMVRLYVEDRALWGGGRDQVTPDDGADLMRLAVRDAHPDWRHADVRTYLKTAAEIEDLAEGGRTSGALGHAPPPPRKRAPAPAPASPPGGEVIQMVDRVEKPARPAAASAPDKQAALFNAFDSAVGNALAGLLG